MFSSPAWQDLRLKRVRYLVPWDWARTGQEAEVVAFMAAARARRQDVLVRSPLTAAVSSAAATRAAKPVAHRG